MTVPRTDSKFATIFNRLTNLPSLPEVASKVLRLSEEEASPARLAGLIEADPGITAKVLKLVNSAFYSLRNPVANLSHACSLLGGRTIKSLVLSVSAMGVFKKRCEGFDQVKFWRNSLATAMVSRKTATKVRLGDAETIEEAYICGLLHAAGVPLYVQFYPDDYAEVIELWADTERSLTELEEEEFGAGHPEAGGQLASQWRFPERVVQVIRFHRVPTEEIPEDTEPDVRRMVDVVRVADFWTRRAGLAFHDADVIDDSTPAPLPDWFPVDEDALAQHLGDLGETVASLESVFQSG